MILELSSFIKFSFIVGSKRLFFSAINITGPLLGHYGGLSTSILMMLKRSFSSKSKILTLAYSSGNGFFNPLVYHIPIVIASGYWFSSNKLIRLCLPLLCMLLFIVHPVGREAFFYSWYWLIPVVIHFLPVQMAFTEALGTTFLAHGVGSVVMLYYTPMPAEYWLGLMPIVIVERLLFASGMTLIFYGSNWVMQMWQAHKETLMSVVGITKKI